MNKNIILCGVGGQGTVLASKLIAAAAMEKGIPVMSAETIGMAQRGGSVFSHVRMGENLYSPMIAKGTADMILGFEPGETVRMLPYLKKNGAVVVSNRAVMPVTASLAKTGYNGASMIEYLETQVDQVLVIDTDQHTDTSTSSPHTSLSNIPAEFFGLSSSVIPSRTRYLSRICCFINTSKNSSVSAFAVSRSTSYSS